MRATLVCVLTLIASAALADELSSAVRLRDTVLTGARRLAIIETAQGGQRLVAEGDTIGACLVKRIRDDGIDLDCHGRQRSLAVEGRQRTVMHPTSRAANPTNVT